MHAAPPATATLPARPLREPRARRTPPGAGFTLIELLLSTSVVVIVALMGVMHATRTSQNVQHARDSGFARQRAVSILGELKSFVQGDEDNTAAELDAFDDGNGWSEILTITPDRTSPTGLVAPDHPISGNVRDGSAWMWARRIEVRPLGEASSRDLRLVTVRVYRHRGDQTPPGELMGEASSVIRTLGEAYPTTQVFDLYLLALENVPGWWVSMDVMQPFIQAALTDLQARNPGLEFRTHWITRLDYGRNEEYAPYTNEERVSTDRTPWTYVYPGRLPDGEAAARYYVPRRMGARLNLDGETAPAFVGGYELPEEFRDDNENGRHDAGEPFDDADDDGTRDAGNLAPYALADMHNHAMRWPESDARFRQRVEAGLEEEDSPPLRLLLDRMIAEPARFRNAIFVNLHGELLPMPPARNVSDAARDPEARQGWRVVTHPEHLRPARVAGSDSSTQAPRFRVYAWKADMSSSEVLTTQREPLADANGDGVWNAGEAYVDWNDNGVWDAGLPITVLVRGGDFSAAPNAATHPSIRIQCLPGGIDADDSGSADAYASAFQNAVTYPESYQDANRDGIRQVVEPWLDLDGDGERDSFEPFQDLDANGQRAASTETLADSNGNGTFDPDSPREPLTDANGNGRWDAAEPYWDRNGDGQRNAATTPKSPWVAWNPADYGNTSKTNTYIKNYGEPFSDLDGDKKYDGAESFTDLNGNGRWDGGWSRGEMWYQVRYDAAAGGTVVTLHGTPLETPYHSSSQRGLPASHRLYDLDYVPCPTPSSATDTNRFARDLGTAGSGFPKNTARWVLELPPAAMRRAFETAPGANDGDRADRTIAVETRLGTDLATGTMWPVRRKPANRSVTYAYFHASPATVPFSERYQFLGDPRHSPYADTDRQGTTAAHGYNWSFDDFSNSSTDSESLWPAFEGGRLRDGWMGRGSGHDVARLMSWFREAITSTGAVYTTLTGFSYYYLSVGGDVGADSANGFPDSIPMDGTPFALTGAVNENTFTSGEGTSSIRGSLKHVRSNAGSTSAGIRSGGVWWSKPWLGELYQDSAYAGQWAVWGNLRAATGTTAGTYRLVRRADLPSAQQPAGTTLVNLYGRLGEEGSTSFFNIGTSSSTFHHQYHDGRTGGLVEDGAQLAQNYALTIPSRVGISRPFGLATNASGGTGPEFPYTDAYPRFTAAMVRRFFDHEAGQVGSGIVRLQKTTSSPSAAFVVVNGLDRTTSSGSAFIARYAVSSLIHALFAAGAPGVPNRIRQLPQIELTYPTLTTEIKNPASLSIRWACRWARWDGRPYTNAYPTSFQESSADLRYVLLWSKDSGATWQNLKDGSDAELGKMPWIDGVGPDPARTLAATSADGRESWTWQTPRDDVPQGSYFVRVEAFRADEPLHYSYHMEKIYVDR